MGIKALVEYINWQSLPEGYQEYSPKWGMFCTTFLVVLVCSIPAFGAEMQKEIDHLLHFVEHTRCQYERNGTLHSGKEAVEHIKNKYRYFKNEIDTTERFIELSATKSTMSGKLYWVHCPNRPKLRSQDWLLHELDTYRKESID